MGRLLAGASLWEELAARSVLVGAPAGEPQGHALGSGLFVLVAYRLLAPGSEWRLHREWFERTALADLLGGDFGLAEIHKLYRCHDRLLEHKEALFDHLTERWRDLFAASFDLLLYDLTSTYFESRAAVPGRRQATLRLLARPSARLRAGGDRAGGHARRVCRWPTRCCPATPRTRRRCGTFSPESSGNMARPSASG